MTPERLKREYGVAKANLLVALGFCAVGMLILWLFPGVLWLGWTILGLSAFGVVGWAITLIALRRQL